MTVTSAQYKQNQLGETYAVDAVIDGVALLVPIDSANRHYQAILDWVAEGNTIADAD